ncbi:MAG: DUF1549 domain-containing protein, partial [Planctomycetota bacterium]|nr:DUF1549 domain-containing protein [Planctomycetota bacterium]
MISPAIGDNKFFNVDSLNSKMQYRLFLSLVVLVMTGPLYTQDNDKDLQKAHFFEKAIRPVLEEKCIACHGPEKQESGLRLDGIGYLKKGGDSGPVMVPGHPELSLLIKAIEHSSDLQMPPREKLHPPQITAIRAWISDGAIWPGSENIEAAPSKSAKHWSFQKIANPTPPVVKLSSSRKAWVQNPIDQFILEKIFQSELVPSAAAEKRTLIRRAYFDLHGLAPNIKQVEEILNDDRTGAFERLIDRLLGSNRYGEKSARIWMDIARYADNKGYVFFEDKNYPWAWTYREWLINAFNQDMPFDKFIVNQIAADFLSSSEAKTNLPALGFLTVGAKFVNNVNDQIDDRIDLVT